MEPDNRESDNRICQSHREKPSESSILYDLIGHTLSEGPTGGYHPEGWNYIIEDNDIMDFEIDQILEDNDHEYTVIVSMELRGSSSLNCNFFYDTRAQIRYVNNPRSGWVLDYIHSLGMEVISDGQYDYMISDRLVERGWSRGAKGLEIQNNGECAIIVGGQIYVNYPDRWEKFLVVIPPYEKDLQEPVIDYSIDFVVREN